jgi:hypothetical protein
MSPPRVPRNSAFALTSLPSVTFSSTVNGLTIHAFKSRYSFSAKYPLMDSLTDSMCLISSAIEHFYLVASSRVVSSNHTHASPAWSLPTKPGTVSWALRVFTTFPYSEKFSLLVSVRKPTGCATRGMNVGSINCCSVLTLADQRSSLSRSTQFKTFPGAITSEYLYEMDAKKIQLQPLHTIL